jgi:hypothetical protein
MSGLPRRSGTPAWRHCYEMQQLGVIHSCRSKAGGEAAYAWSRRRSNAMPASSPCALPSSKPRLTSPAAPGPGPGGMPCLDTAHLFTPAPQIASSSSSLQWSTTLAKLLAAMAPLAATAGSPMPGKVESPQHSSPGMGVVPPAVDVAAHRCSGWQAHPVPQLLATFNPR